MPWFLLASRARLCGIPPAGPSQGAFDTAARATLSRGNFTYPCGRQATTGHIRPRRMTAFAGGGGAVGKTRAGLVGIVRSNAVIRLMAGASFGFTGAAFAADMPVKAPPAPAVYNWSGFGGGIKDWGGINFLAQGPIAGAQIGVNQQIGNVVLGVEVDASWSGIKGRQFEEVTVPFSPSLFQATINSKIENLQTFALRFGLAADRWLIYLKGGV